MNSRRFVFKNFTTHSFVQHPALKNCENCEKNLLTHIFNVRNLSLSQLYFDFFEIFVQRQRWRVTLLFFIIPNLLKKTSQILKPEPNLNIVHIFELDLSNMSRLNSQKGVIEKMFTDFLGIQPKYVRSKTRKNSNKPSSSRFSQSKIF